MTLAPLLAASPIIQIHADAATLALLLGAANLLRRRRDALHRALGRVWVGAMAVVALSSFGIRGFELVGPFGPLHLLSLWVLWSLWSGVREARAGRIEAHHATFRSLYRYGLLVAGAATLLPGRRLNQVLFPEAPEAGYAVLAVIGAAVIWREISDRRAAGRKWSAL
ncbi:DUF2306 domain-containing protein [Jannaschia formosa]|uniref:DUF2306 domain-containing protein n=1 Tax=Jannaschia formosa TaxID=2259592 RepID=UPI000E1BE076|nr:DUF2306 domain-containing protein [Jannaschia formosa]TFL20048.1 DUF2306 domain-containing protein [Jannaschia formosa]